MPILAQNAGSHVRVHHVCVSARVRPESHHPFSASNARYLSNLVRACPSIPGRAVVLSHIALSISDPRDKHTLKIIQIYQSLSPPFAIKTPVMIMCTLPAYVGNIIIRIIGFRKAVWAIDTCTLFFLHISGNELTLFGGGVRTVNDNSIRFFVVGWLITKVSQSMFRGHGPKITASFCAQNASMYTGTKFKW